MRTAEVCPTCATFINSDCVLYTGPYLTTLNINFLDNITTTLIKIEEWATALQDCCNSGGSGDNPIDYSRLILKINNMAVNKRANTNYFFIEVGDLIDGEYPLNSGRFIKAKVIALPYTVEANLQIYSDETP